ncbi:MAG: beta-galactosidase [bacterium]
MKNWGPINPKFAHMYHGGDYNPDQWLHMPEILKEDIRLMKLADCNVMSVAIFAWAALEPEEGKYTFGWLDDVLDCLHENGIYAVLATPSGARPAWMAQKYPEVLRVGPDRKRNLFGLRHNHCFTSPVYREKTQAINRKLAERYGKHPAVLLWHLSNEYGGECHCDLCQEAFRSWLKRKYEGDLDRLNRAWWTAFWSHTYTDWSQIQSPAPHGETRVHGHNLDWRRFVTDQTVDFMRAEIAPLKEVAPDLPVTTNLMGTYYNLDYWKFAPHLDVISWDNYPCWHGIGSVNNPRGNWDIEGRDWRLAADVGFVHDLNRSLKGGKPFIMMESTPSMTNWMSVSKLKRPGMHLLSSIQAVAHGSDTVQYFQWRKGRGGPEKFHGAVVDHVGHERTRVFADVAEVGRVLAKLDDVIGTSVPSETAIIFDWENRWALDDAEGPLNDGRKNYERTCKNHYYQFWARGIPVDVINMDCSFDRYKLVIAPMLYMVRPGVAERLERFVRQGGVFVTTYWSGIVDENDLCFLGGFPGPLRKLLGIWSEEIDALYPVESNGIVFQKGNSLGLEGTYKATDLCDLIHSEGAEVLATYEGDFYKGRPAVTVNNFGKGRAYYIASRNEERFHKDFYTCLVRDLKIVRVLDADLPEGVTAQMRGDDENSFLFLLNFTQKERTISLGSSSWFDLISDRTISGSVALGPFGVGIYRKQSGGA